MRLFWSSKTIKKEVVPGSALYVDKDQTEHGLKGNYTSLKTYLCYTQNKGNLYAISFEWPEEQLLLKIPHPGDKAKVKMLGLDRYLDWSYENDTLIIHTESITYSELPSHDAWTFQINKN